MKSIIYEPAEDSYLLNETLKEYLGNLIKYNQDKSIKRSPSSLKILDMGTGSGIQAKTCKDFGFDNVLAADINKEAVKELKKQKINAIDSNLFSNISKNERFDLIIFNPPYLPEDKQEPEDSKGATTAGKEGYEIIIKFLKEAKSHLNKDGTILLLFSSHSKPTVIKREAKQMNYNIKLLKRQKLFFEELFVYRIKN